MTYRPDIDGLRSVAVFSVILYHLNSDLLPGGFTGVDIFFVISGFLITQNIFNGVNNGRFSITDFYSRRVRRIFPALFTVLLASALLAVIVFNPEMYQKFFGELRFAAIQASNFLFSQEPGYFEAGYDKSPLLHTWSLGVEEQFYLLWPAFILLVSKFKKNTLSYSILLVTIGTFVCNLLLTPSSPKLAFYMLYSRAWELGAGGLLAIGFFPGVSSGVLNNLLSFLGLFLQAAAFFLIDASRPFPGFYALLPVVGAALLIYTGKHCRTVLFKVLSLILLTGLGKISYSLYLWHWPVLIYYKTVTGNEVDFISGTLIVCATIALSTGSYFLVEKPCRFANLPDLPGRLYQKLVLKPPKAKFILLSIGLIVLPLLIVRMNLFSTKIEHNKMATTVRVNVELLKSEFPSEKDMISIYWRGAGEPFNEENSKHFYYNHACVQPDGSFSFDFRIPDLISIKSLRLDPLRGVGIVRISGITLSGGLFGRSVHLDLSGFIKNNSAQSGSNTVSYANNRLLFESKSADPNLSLFDDNAPGNYFDQAILFCIILAISLLLLAAARSIKKKQQQKAVLFFGVVIVFLTLVSATRIQYSAFSQWRFIDSDNLQRWLATTVMTNMAIFDKPAGQQVILLGDSHVGYYAAPLKKWSEAHGFSFGVFGQPACPPIYYQAPGEKEQIARYVMCTRRHNRQIDKILGNTETKYVFLAFRQGFYFACPEFYINPELISMPGGQTAEKIMKESIRNTVETLLGSGKKVIILGQVPALREPPKMCLSRNVTLLPAFLRISPSCDIDSEYSDKRLETGRHFFMDMARQHQNVFYFEPAGYLSTIFGKNGDLLYFDDNHLSHSGSIYIYPFFEHDMNDWIDSS